MTEKFLRALFYRIRSGERRILSELRVNPRGLAARLMNANMIRISRDGICRGFAVGMFWGFTPMPFQMLPAAVFCWLARANLPVAIFCVWISNPFTYLPIFFLEYQVGAALFADGAMNWQEFKALGEGGNLFANMLKEIGLPLLQGALVMCTVMSVAGYGLGVLLFRWIEKRRTRKQELARGIKTGKTTHAHPN